MYLIEKSAHLLRATSREWAVKVDPLSVLPLGCLTNGVHFKNPPCATLINRGNGHKNSMTVGNFSKSAPDLRLTQKRGKGHGRPENVHKL